MSIPSISLFFAQPYYLFRLDGFLELHKLSLDANSEVLVICDNSTKSYIESILKGDSSFEFNIVCFSPQDLNALYLCLISINPHDVVSIYSHSSFYYDFGLSFSLFSGYDHICFFLYEGSAGKSNYNNMLIASSHQKSWRSEILSRRYQLVPLKIVNFYSEYIYDTLLLLYYCLIFLFRFRVSPYIPPVDGLFRLRRFHSLNSARNIYSKSSSLQSAAESFRYSIPASLVNLQSIRPSSKTISLPFKYQRNNDFQNSKSFYILICPSYKFICAMIKDGLFTFECVVERWSNLILAILASHPSAKISFCLHPKAPPESPYLSIFSAIERNHQVVILPQNSDTFYEYVAQADVLIGETSSALLYGNRIGLITACVDLFSSHEIKVFSEVNSIPILQLFFP